jgi:hypothetical protein
MTSFAASIKSNNRYAKNTLVVPSKTGKEAQESKCNVDPKVGPLRPSFSNCSVPRKLNSNKTKKKTWYGEKNHKIPSGFSTITESTIEEESEDDEHAHSDEDDILRPPPSLSALAPRAATSSISSNNTTKNEWAAQWEKSTNSKPVKFKQDTTADFDELLYANKSGTTLSDIDVDALADSKQHESSILTSSSRSSSTEKAVLPKSQLLAPKTSSSSSFASQTRRYKKSSNAFAAWTKR